MKLSQVTPVVAAALSLQACISLGPDYRRPELTPPAEYSQPGAGAPIPEEWWKLFHDPVLDQLVEEAMAGNQDLAAAAARVDEARALLGVTQADRFPELEAGVSGSRTKLSPATAQIPPGFPLELDRYRATASLSYEFDFWGRYARASEAARAELLASEEGRRNVRLAVASDVAAAYFDLLALDRQLAVARETLTSRQESARLQKLRFDAGSISELDVSQAEAELAEAEATVPALERRLAQTEHRLGVLRGRFGGAVERRADLARLELPQVPAGVPSQLLARRPDVVAAELALVAANARIGIARAEYFPTISLTGYTGSESKELGDLLASGTGIWQLAANLVQPIFQHGRAKRNLEAVRARDRQALAAYVKSVQTAFAEVEDALVARSTGAAERAALERVVEALGRARRLARLRYDAGDSSYLELLDAERSLFRAELACEQSRRAEAGAVLSLVRALGGGWQQEPAPAAGGTVSH